MHDDDALLMDRATGERSLDETSLSKKDDDAFLIPCNTAGPLPQLTPLPQMFGNLSPDRRSSRRCALTLRIASRELLDAPGVVVSLHLHHADVLDFGSLGRLAINPKSLLEGVRLRTFCNLDLTTASEPRKFTCRVSIIAQAEGLELNRLHLWIATSCGLSLLSPSRTALSRRLIASGRLDSLKRNLLDDGRMPPVHGLSARVE